MGWSQERSGRRLDLVRKREQLRGGHPRQISRAEGAEWRAGLRAAILPKLLDRTFCCCLYFLPMLSQRECEKDSQNLFWGENWENETPTDHQNTPQSFRIAKKRLADPQISAPRLLSPIHPRATIPAGNSFARAKSKAESSARQGKGRHCNSRGTGRRLL
jgi:hypothetical protein